MAGDRAGPAEVGEQAQTAAGGGGADPVVGGEPMGRGQSGCVPDPTVVDAGDQLLGDLYVHRRVVGPVVVEVDGGVVGSLGSWASPCGAGTGPLYQTVSDTYRHCHGRPGRSGDL